MSKSKIPTFTKETKIEIKERDDYKCFFCEGSTDLTIAHIFVPRRDFGEPVEENGMCICRKCHDALDFGIGVDRKTQIKMLRLCEMYLTLYYMREFKNEDLTQKVRRRSLNERKC